MEMNPALIPPYFPSLSRLAGMEPSAGMPAREYSRTLIGSNTPGGMMLTVPLTGGASAAKRLHPGELEISGHVDWTRIHLGAIDAAYGKEPYFQHCFPEIASAITAYPRLLADLNRTLLAVMLESIGYEEAGEEIAGFREAHPARYASIRERLLRKIDPGHALMEPLFRLGPDTLFLLPPAKTQKQDTLFQFLPERTK